MTKDQASWQLEDLNAALDRSPIGDALARLSPQHRAVVRRPYYLGWTTARIADDLHIADDTVKSRLDHAMRALWLACRKWESQAFDRNER